MRKNKNIRLYSQTPYWFFFMYPSFVVFILLPISFILNSIILLAGFALVKIPTIMSVYKKVILKVWLFGLLGIIICAVLLWIATEVQVRAWIYDYFALIVVLIPGVATYFLNYCFVLNNFKISKFKKILFSLAFVLFTSPYLLLRFYVSVYHFFDPLFYEFDQHFPSFLYLFR